MLARTLLPFLLLASWVPAQDAAGSEQGHEECSVGVAAPSATVDGRPLLWKNRDAMQRDNVVTAFDDGRFPYVAICNAGSTSRVWGGANAAGFCIMNSVSRDLAGDNATGPSNGPFMKLALQRCTTVDEFETLLEQTNRSGRRTRANFGVIDALGAAAIFETGHAHFVRFDATDDSAGILVRTNFATTADGERGRERFARASALCFELPADRRLDHRYLLQTFCRDLTPPPSAVAAEPGRQDVRETIHRQTTVAAMVFHGVRRGEHPRTTTMWAVLGQPMFSIAVPCWPAAEAVSAEMSGSPRSALCDAARQLQDTFYEEPAAGEAESGEDEVAGAIRWLRTEDLETVRADILLAETRILDAAAARLDRWRSGFAPTPDAMLSFHVRQATAALRAVRALAEEHALVGANGR